MCRFDNPQKIIQTKCRDNTDDIYMVGRRVALEQQYSFVMVIETNYANDKFGLLFC